MVNTVVNSTITHRELSFVRDYARLHGWRLELPDTANRVFYFKAANNKHVRRTLDSMIWEMAEFGLRTVAPLERDLDDGTEH